MPKKYISKAIILATVALIFSMHQATPGQKKRPKGVKADPVAIKTVPPEISYTVSMSKPWTHLLEVEMRVKWAKMPEKTELKMPVWTPGSYLIREYARIIKARTYDQVAVPVGVVGFLGLCRVVTHGRAQAWIQSRRRHL